MKKTLYKILIAVGLLIPSMTTLASADVVYKATPSITVEQQATETGDNIKQQATTKGGNSEEIGNNVYDRGEKTVNGLNIEQSAEGITNNLGQPTGLNEQGVSGILARFRNVAINQWFGPVWTTIMVGLFMLAAIFTATGIFSLIMGRGNIWKVILPALSYIIFMALINAVFGSTGVGFMDSTINYIFNG